MKLKKSTITGLSLIVLALAVLVMTFQLSTPMKAEYPGPKLFPLLAGGGLLICALGILFQGLKLEEVADKADWKKILICLASLILYLPALNYLGFLISTPFMLFFNINLFEKAAQEKVTLKWKLIIAIGLTLLIYVAYTKFFAMSLPKGMLLN